MGDATIRVLLVGGPLNGERWTIPASLTVFRLPSRQDPVVGWTRRSKVTSINTTGYEYELRERDDINEQGERLYRYRGTF